MSQRIKLANQLRFAHQGHTVRSYGPGELEVGGKLDEQGHIPQDAADYALDNQLAEKMKDNNPPPPAELTVAEVVEAIRGMDKAATELWTGDGKPQTKALAVLLGKDIPATLRDEAWIAVQAEESKE